MFAVGDVFHGRTVFFFFLSLRVSTKKQGEREREFEDLKTRKSDAPKTYEFENSRNKKLEKFDKLKVPW